MICTEAVLADTPFVVRRRVKWGECDPAGVVYTPSFSEYVACETHQLANPSHQGQTA